MNLPSIGSLFQVGAPIMANYLHGQQQGEQLLYDRQRQQEEDKRKAELHALQLQLTQANLNRVQDPPTPWEAAGFTAPEEQLTYLESLQRIQNPRLPEWQKQGYASEEEYLGYLGRRHDVERDDRTPWESEGFESADEYAAWLEREGRAKNPDRYDGPMGNSRMSPEERRNSFLWNYLLKTNQGRMDPTTFEYIEAPPPEERIRQGVKAWEELQRLTNPEYNPADDEPALPAEGWHPPMAPDADPADFGDPAFAFPAQDTVANAPAPPEAGPVPTPPATGTDAASRVARRIAELKASGLSKEDGFRILQQEGYLDASGNIIAE
jgi:hypothetical protein